MHDPAGLFYGGRGCATLRTSMPRRPNIIVILVDDLGWRDLECYGSPFYETPAMDRLCASGMRFTDAYAACPVCSPTRASILTGRYPARVGITDWIDWAQHTHPARGRLVDVSYLRDLPLTELTYARALAPQGYTSWHVGKWHLGGPGHLPQDVGFDVNVGGCQQGSPGRGGYFSPWSIPPLADVDVPQGTYLDDYLTDRAISLIRSHTGGPFLLNLWYYLVHTPIQAPPEPVAKYERKARLLGLDSGTALVEDGSFPSEHRSEHRILRRVIQSHPVYAAMVQTLDRNVGRLLGALEELGVGENTVIIFSSDNGGLSTSEGSPTCNAPLSEGKGWMYEGGTRVPLFVSWPGVIRPGSVCPHPVTSVDLAPTMLAMAGADPRPDRHVDGVSLMPLLGGEQAPARPLFWHYPHYGNQGGTPAAAVREGRWKLIRFFEDGHEELYDLGQDIGETTNLAQTHPAQTGRLSELLTRWQSDVEALIPEPNPRYEPWAGRVPCGHFAPAYPENTAPEV